MFKNLLVPLDGSRLAETSLPVAAYLARSLNARATLLHIVERDAPEEIHGEKHLKTPAEAQKYLDQVSSAFLRGLQVDWHIENGEASGVARLVQEYAVAAKTDLIVMCTHGRSGFRHLILGSNAQQVAAIGTIPVLQVRPTENAGQAYACRKILAPLDGKAPHEQGLKVSVALARALAADLHILGVVPTPWTLGGEGAAAARLSPRTASAMLDIQLGEIEDYQHRRLAELQKEGVRATTGIERGDPADAILRAAKRIQVDLIVVATHRKAGTDAFWSGSVAPKVAKRSPVPVLLIPLGES